MKLYRYDREKGKWVFVDYGVKSKVKEYILQGYVVIYIWQGDQSSYQNNIKRKDGDEYGR